MEMRGGVDALTFVLTPYTLADASARETEPSACGPFTLLRALTHTGINWGFCSRLPLASAL